MPLILSARQASASIAAVYRRYAEWLVSISWKRFIVLSIVLLIVAGILSGLPPFTWDLVEPKIVKSARSSRDVNVTVDENGVRITPKRQRKNAPEIVIDENGVQIRRPGEEIIIDQHGVQRRHGTAQPVPPKAPAPPRLPEDEDDADAMAEAQRDLTQDSSSLAQEIRREIAGAISEMNDRERVVHVRLGDYLPQLAFLFILLSAAVKIAYARTVKAEAQAAEAHGVAEQESLRRQLAEAKMAAMQAQIEPHFLFNTLASIDHLIETDPPRASQMQKNLIALLRASMPAMRDRATSLGRELEVVRPYLEILKVRMGERLQAQVSVPEGLYSADFPPMMLQSLVENAIKHGLEPKAEGGALTVAAEVVHGKLAVTVADTGVGFARAATAGTGMGLQNIRERLKLIYGDAAELRIAENTPSGTRVSIVVPYKATT
jgi:histidine kinase/histidine kinase/DNA gyrase B/HSP90-like ATPase